MLLFGRMSEMGSKPPFGGAAEGQPGLALAQSTRPALSCQSSSIHAAGQHSQMLSLDVCCSERRCLLCTALRG